MPGRLMNAARARLANRSSPVGSLDLARASIRAGLASLLFCLATPLGAEIAKDTRALKGDREFGEYLSSVCVTCHQISGKATAGIPPIIAWPEDQFIAIMNAYRSKERDNLVMQTITAPLTNEEIAALAAYFGALPNQPDIK